MAFLKIDYVLMVICLETITGRINWESGLWVEAKLFSSIAANLFLPLLIPFPLYFLKGSNFSEWASTIPGIALSTTIEFPYANVSGIVVSKDNARVFGRALAYSIQDYLKSLNTEITGRWILTFYTCIPIGINRVIDKDGSDW